MNVLKKSLLVSTVLFCGVGNSWAMFSEDGLYGQGTASSSQSSSLRRDPRNLDPLRHVSQFTIPAEEASRLLSPHWRHGVKGKLSKLIGVSQSTLKSLIDDKKKNKALGEFNIALIEKDGVWNLFSSFEQAQIILGQLIRLTSEEDVATQLGIRLEQLNSFQKGSRDQDILQRLPNLEIENWAQLATIVQHPILSNTVSRIPATYDQKAIPGYGLVQPLRAILHMDGEYKALYGSSDRERGHIPPDTRILTAKQLRHLDQFEAIEGVFQSADPRVSPNRLTELVSDLSIQSSPIPGVGKIYVESPRQKKSLQRHRHLEADMSVKLFTDGTAAPNFCSKTDESLSETRAKCRPKDSTYDGDRQLPIEVYGYHHTLPTGHVITFDRGHGCDHADTLEHAGTLSTSDIDNFVPQNSFYNRNIRNHLVNKIRIAGGEYKEISLYHQDPYKTEETRIPEGFIFIELYDGKAETAYFFPNLIAYEALDFEKSYKSNYLNFLELFRINDLIGYFYIPFVQAQNPIPHMEQRDKGTILSCRIYADIVSLFDNLTEYAFPPRARTTLIKSIMNQGINTAAILDFEGLTSLETAINHYANSRIYWELDDRLEGERQTACDTCFPKLSGPIQQAYEATKMKFPSECGNQRIFKEAMTLSLGSLFTKMGDADQAIIRSIIGGRSIKNIELAKKYLKVAFSKIEAGDYNNRGLRGITSILRSIPELEDLDRADSLATLIKADEAQSSTNDEFIAFHSSLPDPLFDIHHFFTFGALKNKLEEGIHEIRSGNLKTQTLFEMMLILESEPSAEQFISFKEVYDLLLSLDLLESTLEEKKKIADFLYQARYYDEEDKWIEKIMDHFNEEPTQKNADLVSSWLREGSGCIKKNILGAQTILEIAALNSLLWDTIPQ